jgi:predicted phosphoribosyltransferase
MTIQMAHEAGRRLARALGTLRNERPFILAIPRGGVLVGETIARELRAPLDVLIAGKALAPDGRAIAGIAVGGPPVFDDAALTHLRLTAAEIERLVERERDRQTALLERIRGTWPSPALDGRTVVLADDAVVSGLTMRAAIESVRARDVRRIVVATPLCSDEASAELAGRADRLVYLESQPAGIAARVHDDSRTKLCPPVGDEEIRQRIVRELRDVGVDPFGPLAIDGI